MGACAMAVLHIDNSGKDQGVKREHHAPRATIGGQPRWGKT